MTLPSSTISAAAIDLELLGGQIEQQLAGGRRHAANLRHGARRRLAAGSAAVVGNQVGIGQDDVLIADGSTRSSSAAACVTEVRTFCPTSVLPQYSVIWPSSAMCS